MKLGELKMKASPNNSRYVPFTQQPACCVPTCLQIVMYKEGIPLVPAEEIGYYMGLVVRPEKKNLFFDVRTAEEAPAAGYGIQRMPDAAFEAMGIPLTFTVRPIADFPTKTDLLQELLRVEANNGNALLCFNQGGLVDDDSQNWGHVGVFDRVVKGQIRMIDPSPEQPKWRLVPVENLFNGMKKRGVQIAAGVWLLEPKLGR
jgi:hypothetical protein